MLRSLPRKTLIVHSRCFLDLGWKEIFQQGAEISSRKLSFFCQRDEPEVADVLEVSRMLQEFSCVAGVGGGGVQDLCALASLGCKTSEDLESYLYHGSGSPRVAQRKMGYISFPTNYSSGSFITKSAVVRRDHYKFSAFGPGLKPDRVFIDPAVLSHLDQPGWNLSSIDILSHFVEIFTGTSMDHSLYFHSLQGWYGDLERALLQHDFERLFFLSSTLMGGFYPLQSVSWPIHALAHAVGPRLGIGHCAALSLLLPYFLDFYIEKYQAHSETLKLCKEYLAGLKLPHAPLPMSALQEAINTAQANNARLFPHSQAGEEYQRILKPRLKSLHEKSGPC